MQDGDGALDPSKEKEDIQAYRSLMDGYHTIREHQARIMVGVKTDMPGGYERAISIVATDTAMKLTEFNATADPKIREFFKDELDGLEDFLATV